MAKKKSPQKESIHSKLLFPLIVGSIILVIVAIALFATYKPRDVVVQSLFISENESLVRWYNASMYSVTLADEGFVEGRVEKKVRTGDPSFAPTLIGAYEFESRSKAKQFYESLLTKDPFFANETDAISTEKIDATCQAYQVKEAITKQFPPINLVHLICQKETVVIEILLRSYKVDSPQVTTQIAATMLKKVSF